MSEELTVIPRETALSVLTSEEKFDAFYAKVKAETDAFVPDLTTPTGRKAVASMAFKVTKTKTAIDTAGQLLTEEWRTNTKKVDDARRAIRAKLDELRDEVRKPLTDWEETENLREQAVEAGLELLRQAKVVPMDATAADVQAVLDHIKGLEFPEVTFLGLLPVVEAQRSEVVKYLDEKIAAIEQRDRDAAELAELRRANEERAAAEAAERERTQLEQQAAEAAERAAREETERVERERRAAEEAAAEEAARVERERLAVERAAQEAAARAEAETRRVAEEQAAAREAAHRAELAAAQAETERLAQAEADRLAREAEEQREAARRLADRAHKAKIMAAAKTAIMGLSTDDIFIPETLAVTIVRAIVAGEIPNVTLTF